MGVGQSDLLAKHVSSFLHPQQGSTHPTPRHPHGSTRTTSLPAPSPFNHFISDSALACHRPKTRSNLQRSLGERRGQRAESSPGANLLHPWVPPGTTWMLHGAQLILSLSPHGGRNIIVSPSSTGGQGHPAGREGAPSSLVRADGREVTALPRVRGCGQPELWVPSLTACSGQIQEGPGGRGHPVCSEPTRYSSELPEDGTKGFCPWLWLELTHAL